MYWNFLKVFILHNVLLSTLLFCFLIDTFPPRKLLSLSLLRSKKLISRATALLGISIELLVVLLVKIVLVAVFIVFNVLLDVDVEFDVVFVLLVFSLEMGR